MVRDIWERFASKLESLDEAPEPLRGVMAEALASAKPRILVFAPAWKIGDRCSPATLLAVLSEGWIVVSGTSETAPIVHRASFDDTLFIELKIVLLSGRLTLNYAADNAMRSAVAVQRILDTSLLTLKPFFRGSPACGAQASCA